MTATFTPFPVLAFHICSAFIGPKYRCCDCASSAVATGCDSHTHSGQGADECTHGARSTPEARRDERSLLGSSAGP
ncbi:hypothetical protein SALBM311S_09557 [Streptomyces alboniger]